MTGFRSFNNSTCKSSESVGSRLRDTQGGCSKDNYSNQVWSEQWRCQCYKLLWNWIKLRTDTTELSNTLVLNVRVVTQTWVMMGPRMGREGTPIQPFYGILIQRRRRNDYTQRYLCPMTIKYFLNTRMWANAQRDGRPAEHRWRPLINAAKFGWRPLLDAVQYRCQDEKPVEICRGAPHSRTDLSR